MDNIINCRFCGQKHRGLCNQDLPVKQSVKPVKAVVTPANVVVTQPVMVVTESKPIKQVVVTGSKPVVTDKPMVVTQSRSKDRHKGSRAEYMREYRKRA